MHVVTLMVAYPKAAVVPLAFTDAAIMGAECALNAHLGVTDLVVLGWSCPSLESVVGLPALGPAGRIGMEMKVSSAAGPPVGGRLGEGGLSEGVLVP